MRRKLEGVSREEREIVGIVAVAIEDRMIGNRHREVVAGSRRLLDFREGLGVGYLELEVLLLPEQGGVLALELLQGVVGVAGVGFGWRWSFGRAGNHARDQSPRPEFKARRNGRL